MKKQLNMDAVSKLITDMDLTKECRLNQYLYPRSILYHNIRKELGWSYQSIANLFGKNHATVMNGIFKYRELSRKKKHEFELYKHRIEGIIFNIEYEDKIKEEMTLYQKILDCSDYWQMRKLQEEIKTKMQLT